MDWWKDAVFYQIYPRSFKDHNNGGAEDFGYDVIDYKNVDSLFDTINDFDELGTCKC